MVFRKCGKDVVFVCVGFIIFCVVCYVVDFGYVWMRFVIKLDGLDC